MGRRSGRLVRCDGTNVDGSRCGNEFRTEGWRTKLAAYAELRVVLETAPWSGRPYHRDNPHGAVRVRPFGTYGLVMYLILEDQRRVDVLLVQWGG